jgi:hypothetical protein
MNCQNYQLILDAYIDGTVTPQQIQQLETHVQSCETCRREYETHRKMKLVLGECLTMSEPSDKNIQSVLANVSTQDFAADTIPASTFRWLGYAAAAGIFLAIGVLIGSWDKIQIISTQHQSLAISVTNLKGDILIKHPWENSWKTLAVNEPIYKGDAFLSLNQSAVRLVLGPNKYVELDQNSSLNLMQYNGQTEFGIAYGTVKSSLDGPHEPFFISTPQGRLQALGTEFIVKVR